MSAKILLPLLSVSVFYFIFYFADINGLRALSKEYIAAGTLPGTKAPLRTHYTGIAQVDEILTILTVFFWTVVDGSHPSLFLHSFAFSGTFAGGWILITLESWRKASKGKIIAFPAIFGLTAQVLTYAFAASLYLSIHLFTSQDVGRPTAASIRVHPTILKAIPAVFIVGKLVPSALMMAPESATVTTDVKQIFIAIWQPWPAYVAILLSTIYVLSSVVGCKEDTSAEGTRKSRRALRHVYAFAFANAAITHLVMVITTAGTVVVPFILQHRFVEALHPSQVFHTPLPWTTPVVKVLTISQGVQGFLRWDYIIASASVLIWAVSVYRSAHKFVYGKVDTCDLAVKTALLSILAGPVAAAVELVWERDELVLNQSGKESAGQKKR